MSIGLEKKDISMPRSSSFPTVALSAIPRSVLLISRDRTLLTTRTLLLEHEGHTVVALDTDGAVARFLRSKQPVISLVLICHSVPEASRIIICRTIRERHPLTPILMLFPSFGFTTADVDGTFENVHSPDELISTVQLYTTRKRSAAKAASIQ